jgi:hypothetical protein
MFAKVLADLLAKGVNTSQEALLAQRERVLEQAKKQILDEIAAGRQKLSPSS